MTKKLFILLFILSFAGFNIADAQFRIGARLGGGRGNMRGMLNNRQQHKNQKKPKQNIPTFQPTVNISFGYSYPNLDKNEMPQFYNLYNGNVSQKGPITGSIDYQFSRTMSIGLLATHGTVTIPYFDNLTSNTPALTGSLSSWSFMLNFMRYMPVASSKVLPYVRTAIGINSWQQNFTDPSGSKVNFASQPKDLAYQIGLGAKCMLSKNAGLYVEAGYGKYILNGGLSLNF